MSSHPQSPYGRPANMKVAAHFCALCLLSAAAGAAAQPIYRSVDAAGTVSFSDQPSGSGNSAQAIIAARPAPGASNADSGAAIVPYELRQIMSRYPVSLYTGENCAPCQAGRSWLVKRGVPFFERSVSTPEDSDALQSFSGQKSLPLLSIGTQQLRGFSDAEWSQYLGAAGYPKSSLLPVSYRNAPAAPMVAPRALPPATPEAASLPAAPRAPAAATPNPDNPAGIKF